MNRKLLVLGLALVLAIAIVVPSVAQTGTVSPRVSSDLSQRAMAMARKALHTSREAKRQSRRFAANANAARTDATGAVVTADATQAALESTRVVSAVAETGATTKEERFVALPGGPSATVRVPPSGLIEVWAQVTMDEAGAVSVYQDGQPMPGQSRDCGSPEGEPGLFSAGSSGPLAEPITLATPATLPFCATDGPPAPVLFQTTPGSHTYELRYASCGCNVPGDSPVTFSNRRLYVAPRL